jgi:signal transduction histidine kinase
MFIIALLLKGLLLIGSIKLNDSILHQLRVEQSKVVTGNNHETSILMENRHNNFTYAGNIIFIMVITTAFVLLNVFIKQKNIESDEKEKRASELVMANKELVFQNNEKEKRASELVIANKKLFFQNEERIRQEYKISIAKLLDIEKTKRNDELIVANSKLIAKNIETEKLASELAIFNSSVSHDLKTPLHSIMGFSQIILNDSANILTTSSTDAFLRVINNVNTMNNVINGLQELSNISFLELIKSRVNLSSIAQNLAVELKNLSSTREINFVIKEDLHVDGDPNILAIVMDNLMRNAHKFTSKKAVTNIEFGILENGTYFIRDNGAGFDMRHEKKLFEPFERLHTTKEFQGTGIGLASVQRGIKRHQGKIWAESEVECGATFYFTLG